MNLSARHQPDFHRLPVFVDLHKVQEPSLEGTYKGTLWQGVYRGLRILLAQTPGGTRAWQVWVTDLDGNVHQCAGYRVRETALDDAIVNIEQHLADRGVDSGPTPTENTSIYKKGRKS